MYIGLHVKYRLLLSDFNKSLKLWRNYRKTLKCYIPQKSVKCEPRCSMSFRCHIPVVLNKLNTKYITISQNTTKIIALCCTICFTTTSVSALFLEVIFRLCTLDFEINVSYIQIYYIDDEISVIIIQLPSYYGGYVGRFLWMGTVFGCGLAGMEIMFVSYCSVTTVLSDFLYAAQSIVIYSVLSL